MVWYRFYVLISRRFQYFAKYQLLRKNSFIGILQKIRYGYYIFLYLKFTQKQSLQFPLKVVFTSRPKTFLNNWLSGQFGRVIEETFLSAVQSTGNQIERPAESSDVYLYPPNHRLTLLPTNCLMNFSRNYMYVNNSKFEVHARTRTLRSAVRKSAGSCCVLSFLIQMFVNYNTRSKKKKMIPRNFFSFCSKIS